MNQDYVCARSVTNVDRSVVELNVVINHGARGETPVIKLCNAITV